MFFIFVVSNVHIFEIDNIKLSWEESIPSKGVISYQDYEGTSTVSTSASYGVGTPMVGEDGNHFLKLTTVNDGVNKNALIVPADKADFTKEDVTVDFEDGAVLKAETMKAVLAVYDNEGRLVDVDMDAKAAAAGEISGATLSVDAASYTENGEIKLLVWNGGETAAPILSEAYDISALLK